MKFESFRNFQNISTPKYKEDKILEENEKTPDEIFEESFKQINSSLADDLLSEVMKLSPEAFEQMVIDLLYKMGYGAFENSGKTTSLSCDGGIDGEKLTKLMIEYNFGVNVKKVFEIKSIDLNIFEDYSSNL